MMPNIGNVSQSRNAAAFSTLDLRNKKRSLDPYTDTFGKKNAETI